MITDLSILYKQFLFSLPICTNLDLCNKNIGRNLRYFLILLFTFSSIQAMQNELLDAPVIISLSRHMERYNRTKELMEQAGFSHIQRFEAIDGATVNDDFFHRLNIMDSRLARKGCSASHLTVWKHFAEGSSEKEHLFICEDDMLPHSDFATLFPLYWEATPKDFDLIMVGNKFNEKVKTEEKVISSPAIALHAYIVTKKGAQILFDEYQKIPEGSSEQDYIIDNFVSKMMQEKKITYYCYNGKKYPDKENKRKIRKNFSSGICFQNLEFDSTISDKNLLKKLDRKIKSFFSSKK